MGSGVSSKKLFSDGSAYRRPSTTVVMESMPETHHALEPQRTSPVLRLCDRCGETRKTTCLGDGTEWLCAACQLQDGRLPQRLLKGEQETAGRLPQPRPVLRRPGQPTGSVPGVLAGPGGAGSGLDTKGLGSWEEDALAPRNKAARRGRCKESQAPAQVANEEHSVPTSPQLLRAQTCALGKLPRGDFRGAEIIREIRGGMVRAKTMVLPGDGAKESSSAHPSQSVPVRKLAAGYSYGDQVQSLVSRMRGQLLVLELGHTGKVVAVARKDDSPLAPKDDHLRLLVQFQPGFDWWLPPHHICAVSSYAAMKSCGVEGFMWGTRVRSLVTFLNPLGAKQELWLGDSGMVIGPGQVRGKLAVRFDDGDEWSLWPSLVCRAEAYSTSVAEKLPGSFYRGDRVKVRTAVRGARVPGEPTALDSGEEGTVVGPGHSNGRVLVHFDSDAHVWSLLPRQIAPCSSCL